MQSESYPDEGDRASSSCRPGFVPSSPVTHILAPTDLTAHSKASVARPVWLARGFDAKLTAAPGDPLKAKRVETGLAWAKE